VCLCLAILFPTSVRPEPIPDQPSGTGQNNTQGGSQMFSIASNCPALNASTFLNFVDSNSAPIGRCSGCLPGVSQSMVESAVGDISTTQITIMFNGESTIRIRANNGMYVTVLTRNQTGSTGGHYVALMKDAVPLASDWNVTAQNSSSGCVYQLLNLMDLNFLGICPVSICPPIVTNFTVGTQSQPTAAYTTNSSDPQVWWSIVSI